MSLTDNDYKQIKNELGYSKNPLFFFDDDADGLCSFLILYRYHKEGHGIIVKTSPNIDNKFLPKVKDYNPDKIFVLDIAMIEQNFIDSAKTPIIWIDHHGPNIRHNVKYFNPRIYDKSHNIPTTCLCYNAVKSNKDIWIATLGCIADCYMPPFFSEFKRQFKDLVDDETKVQEIYFNTKFSELIKAFSFILKGKTNEVMKHIKILTMIETPYEILNQETSKGKFIYNKYKKINALYENLKETCTYKVGKEKFLIFTYEDEKISFTGDLANELLYLYPKKIIIVGRKKDEEIRMSIRTSKTPIQIALNSALHGLDGYGGGHETACGANIKEKDFNEFITKFRKFLKNA